MALPESGRLAFSDVVSVIDSAQNNQEIQGFYLLLKGSLIKSGLYYSIGDDLTYQSVGYSGTPENIYISTNRVSFAVSNNTESTTYFAFYLNGELLAHSMQIGWSTGQIATDISIYSELNVDDTIEVYLFRSEQAFLDTLQDKSKPPPHKLSEYYAGAGIVPEGSVPAAGVLKFSDFYGYVST